MQAQAVGSNAASPELLQRHGRSAGSSTSSNSTDNAGTSNAAESPPQQPTRITLPSMRTILDDREAYLPSTSTYISSSVAGPSRPSMASFAHLLSASGGQSSILSGDHVNGPEQSGTTREGIHGNTGGSHRSSYHPGTAGLTIRDGVDDAIGHLPWLHQSSESTIAGHRERQYIHSPPSTTSTSRLRSPESATFRNDITPTHEAVTARHVWNGSAIREGTADLPCTCRSNHSDTASPSTTWLPPLSHPSFTANPAHTDLADATSAASSSARTNQSRKHLHKDRTSPEPSLGRASKAARLDADRDGDHILRTDSAPPSNAMHDMHLRERLLPIDSNHRHTHSRSPTSPASKMECDPADTDSRDSAAMGCLPESSVQGRHSLQADSARPFEMPSLTSRLQSFSGTSAGGMSALLSPQDLTPGEREHHEAALRLASLAAASKGAGDDAATFAAAARAMNRYPNLQAPPPPRGMYSHYQPARADKATSTEEDRLNWSFSLPLPLAVEHRLQARQHCIAPHKAPVASTSRLPSSKEAMPNASSYGSPPSINAPQHATPRSSTFAALRPLGATPSLHSGESHSLSGGGTISDASSTSSYQSPNPTPESAQHIHATLGDSAMLGYGAQIMTAAEAAALAGKGKSRVVSAPASQHAGSIHGRDSYGAQSSAAVSASSSIPDMNGGGSVSSSGSGKYECEICHRRFARPSALTVHSHMHTGAKPFSCAICDRSFSVNSNLRRHLRTHTRADREAAGIA